MSLADNRTISFSPLRGGEGDCCGLLGSLLVTGATPARIVFLVCALAANSFAQESWQSALSRMPLGVTPGETTELNRTNCVALMLDAFQSNTVVKALIFMPGATDELYFFRRAHATLTNAAPSLRDAVTALTNQTYIQAAFRPPLLVLHTTEDSLDGLAGARNEPATAKLRQRCVPGFVRLIDADWDAVRAKVNPKLSVGLRPFSGAPATWHFYRHNFAACGVTDWEMLETLALAGKTTFTVNGRTARFEPDLRHGVTPKLEHFPPLH